MLLLELAVGSCMLTGVGCKGTLQGFDARLHSHVIAIGIY